MKKHRGQSRDEENYGKLNEKVDGIEYDQLIDTDGLNEKLIEKNSKIVDKVAVFNKCKISNDDGDDVISCAPIIFKLNEDLTERERVYRFPFASVII